MATQPNIDKVMDACVTALSAVTTGSTYWNTLKQVTKGIASPIGSPEIPLPFAAIFARSGTVEEYVIGKSLDTILISVEGWATTTPTYAERDGFRLRADLERAIMADTTLGGTCQSVRMQRWQLARFDTDQFNFVGVKITFEADIMYTRGQP